jgi:hypothetical protein
MKQRSWGGFLEPSFLERFLSSLGDTAFPSYSTPTGGNDIYWQSVLDAHHELLQKHRDAAK